MDFSRLKRNICEVVREEQIKLGYQKEKIYLYYPLTSLNGLLRTKKSVEEMRSLLSEFQKEMREEFGQIEISVEKERFCFLLPPEAVEYIHENYEENPFLEEFISTVSQHGITLENVLMVFKKYSDHLHIEKMSKGEFDYLVYFEDGKPDDFRYCLTDEEGHIIYHRFTPEDYATFTVHTCV